MMGQVRVMLMVMLVLRVGRCGRGRRRHYRARAVERGGLRGRLVVIAMVVVMVVVHRGTIGLVLNASRRVRVTKRGGVDGRGLYCWIRVGRDLGRLQMVWVVVAVVQVKLLVIDLLLMLLRVDRRLLILRGRLAALAHHLVSGLSILN